MTDNMQPDHQDITTRVDAALAAMQRTVAVPTRDTARVAATAVLANAPIRRAQTWMLRAAALLIVAAGGLAVSTRVTRTALPAFAQSDEARSDAESADAVAVMPVIATKARPIVFEFTAPGAQTVQVLGDFNQWSRGASAMRRGADGQWRLTTLLPPGRYVYAFLVDGRRFQRDPARDAVEDRDFGVTGSELVVGEAP